MLIIMTSGYLFVKNVSNFDGSCEEKGRRLTVDEMVNGYLNDTYPDENDKEAMEKRRVRYENREDRHGKKFYYKSKQHFLEVNPYCCEVSDHTPEWGWQLGGYDKFWDPLFGNYLFKLMTHDKNNFYDSKTTYIDFHALDSCGNVLKHRYESDGESKKSLEYSTESIKKERNGKPFELLSGNNINN